MLSRAKKTILCLYLCFTVALPPVVEAAADTPAWVQASIEVAKSPDSSAQARVDAARSLTDAWHDSLRALIQNVDGYYRTDTARPYTSEDIGNLVPLTDIIVTVVVNKDGGVQLFRKLETEKTIKVLAWATRGSDNSASERSLRFNSAYILANVVGNSNLCIILDHLRDPDLGPNGMINLLQVAAVVAGHAYKENLEAIRGTVAILRPRVADAGSGKIAILVATLSQLAESSPNSDMPLPDESSYCRAYQYEHR